MQRSEVATRENPAKLDFSPVEWVTPGTGCLESLWKPHPWDIFKVYWARPHHPNTTLKVHFALSGGLNYKTSNGPFHPKPIDYSLIEFQSLKSV